MSFFVVSAKEVQQYIGRNGTILVDLREEKDYQKGHITTAINIPFDDFDQYRNYLSGFEVIILYCERGNASLLIAREYESSWQKVLTLAGGYIGNKGRFILTAQ